MTTDTPGAPAAPDILASEAAKTGAHARSADLPIEPLPYHRLARLSPRTSRWWTPLSSVGVALGLYIAALVPILVLFIVYGLVAGGNSGLLLPTESLNDPLNPIDWVLTLGLLALMLPAVIFGVRWGGLRKGTIHSIAGRFRWGLLGRAARVVLPVYAVIIVGGMFLWPPDDFAVPPFSAALVISIILVLLLTPLQCAAEEYVFRGLPQQALGTWLRSPLWGILLPVPLFVIGHGYDWAGQISIAAFAICAGFLTWKSGGLELPVLVHTANNLFIFLLAPLSRSSLQQGEVDPLWLLLDLPMILGITAWLTFWVSRRECVSFWESARGTGRAARSPSAREVPVPVDAGRAPSGAPGEPSTQSELSPRDVRPGPDSPLTGRLDLSGLLTPVSVSEVASFSRRNRQPVGRRLWRAAVIFLGYVIWLAAVLNVYSLVAGIGPRADRAAYGLMLVATGVYALIVVGAIWRGAVRRVRLDRTAAANGLDYRTRAIAAGAPGTVLSLVHQQKARDVIRSFGAAEFSAGTFGPIPGYTRRRMGFVRLPIDRNVPHIVLLNRRSRVLRVSGARFLQNQRLRLEGDFDRAFSLFCPIGYERDALYLFTPDLMALLLDVADDCEVELIGSELVLYQGSPWKLWQPRRFAALIALVEALAPKVQRRTARYRDDHAAGGGSTVAAPGRKLQVRPSLGTIAVVSFPLLSMLVGVVVYIGGI